MLQQGELIRVGSCLVKQVIDELLTNRTAKQLRGPNDRLAFFLSGQTRRKKLTVVDFLRKPIENGALTNQSVRIVRTM